MMQSEGRFRFLAQAGELLSASLDKETHLRSLAHLAVPRVADWCAVDYFDEAGALQRLTQPDSPPAPTEPGAEPPMSHTAELYRALRTGQPEFWPELTTATPGDQSAEQPRPELHGEAAACSLIVVPMVGRERILGAISLAMAGSGRHYTEDDLAMAADLARRAAVAIDNTRH
jgi:GAF domain-containing protein